MSKVKRKRYHTYEESVTHVLAEVPRYTVLILSFALGH